MNVIIDLCVVPLGVGLSVSKYVAVCHEIIKEPACPANCMHTAPISKGSGTRCLPW